VEFGPPLESWPPAGSISVHRLEGPTPTQSLIDRLAEHHTLRGTPSAELEWLVSHGELRTYAPGEVVAAKSEPIDLMVVMLTGRIAVHFGHGTGRVHKMESLAGELSGVLPFSRMAKPMGDAVAQEPTDVFALHRDHFPELIRECPVITAKLVHAMIDRARVAAATNWQDEKMMSLGRLAAGFAHQLNNPASAAVRSAKQISLAVTAVGEAAHALGRIALSEAQHAHVAALLHRCLQSAETVRAPSVERSDREDRMAEWLEAHHVDTAPALALANSGVTVDVLEALASAIPRPALEPALRWIAASCAAQSLAADVERASSRIDDLIARLKRFTSMDRAAVAQPMDVAQGLTDTVAVLAGRAASKSVSIRLDVAPDLPFVVAHSVDLNQVWSNLLENAIDAARPGGDVVVGAACGPNAVIVRVIDDGPGIPPDVHAKMFDPFFTTKGVGQGTGLGLDIVRRIVRMHDGEIEVDARPGRTEFRVRIPAPVATGSWTG
jgi:signal transduction histidine kinase